MNEIMEFLTSKEIIVVYIVVAVACLLCFIIYLVDKNHDKRKRKQNTRKLNKLVEDVNLRMREEAKVKASEQPKRDPVNSRPAPVVAQTRVEASQRVVENTKPVVAGGANYQQYEQPTPNVSAASPVVANNDMHYNQTQQNVSYSQPANYQQNTSYQQPNSYQKMSYQQPNYQQDVSYAQNTSYHSNTSQLQSEASNSIEQAMNHQINKVTSKIDELTYTDPEPNKEEATRELIKLAEELEKVERQQRSPGGIDVSKYETEQEQNAIISLEELNKKSEAMYAANEKTQYADEGNEPISLADLERRKMQVVNSEINQPVSVSVQNPVEEVLDYSYSEPKQEQLSFSSTGVVSQNSNYSHAYQGTKRIITQEVFSPVFGFDTKNKTDEEIDEELQKTSEFLLSLKELQSKLNS